MWYPYRNRQSDGFRETSLSWMKDQIRSTEPRVFGRHILASNGISSLTLGQLTEINETIGIPWLSSVERWRDCYQKVSAGFQESHGPDGVREARRIEDAMAAALPASVSFPQLFLLLAYAT